MTGPGARSQSLYRKYRPGTFDERELVGQEHVSRTLRNAVRFDRVAHAYLFYGPRGCGKTTTARLLAKAVNCEDTSPDRRPCNVCAACTAINEGRAVDIIEIDAASNRGIDAMRDLREKVKFSPAQLRAKFYIIDEVHQLTLDAANALLKTLEEPPTHAKFILATTDPEKVPDTISSRCQTFTFRRIPLERMVARLRDVADHERIEADDDALALIARTATGSLRDALGLLDQLSAFVEGPIGIEHVQQLLGAGREQEVVDLVDAIAANDPGAGLRAINATIERGSDPRQFAGQIVAYLRDLLLALATNAPVAGVSEKHRANFTLGEVATLVKRFSQIDHAIKHGVYGQLPLELCLVESIMWRASPEATVTAPARPRATAPGRAVPRHPEAQLAVGAPADAPTPEARSTPIALPASDRATPSAPLPAERAPARADVAEAQALPAAGDSERRPVTTATPLAAGRTNEDEREGEDFSGLTDAQLLGRLREDWQRVRVLIKAVDRKLAAFMASTDLADLRDTELRITAESEFHVNKLNQDNNKSVVEQVLLETYGRQFQVTFEQSSRQRAGRGEPPRGAGVEARPAVPAVTEPETAPVRPEPSVPNQMPPTLAAAGEPEPQALPGPLAAEASNTSLPPAPPIARATELGTAEVPKRVVRERGQDALAPVTPAPVSAEHIERYVQAVRNIFNAVDIKI